MYAKSNLGINLQPKTPLINQIIKYIRNAYSFIQASNIYIEEKNPNNYQQFYFEVRLEHLHVLTTLLWSQAWTPINNFTLKSDLNTQQQVKRWAGFLPEILIRPRWSPVCSVSTVTSLVYILSPNIKTIILYVYNQALKQLNIFYFYHAFD